MLLCIVLLKEDFGNVFLRLNSPEMLVQEVKILILQIRVNSLAIWRNV